MKTQAAVDALGALAQESRLAVYLLLVRRGPDGFNPGELAQRLSIPAPTLSFHLKALQRAGLVTARRQGRFLYYGASFDYMRQLIGFLTENCCSLSDTQCAAACTSAESPRRKRA